MDLFPRSDFHVFRSMGFAPCCSTLGIYGLSLHSIIFLCYQYYRLNMGSSTERVELAGQLQMVKSVSTRSRRSRARVAGLQELHKAVRRARPYHLDQGSSHPLRGGSTSATSARMPWATSNGNSSSAFPVSNRTGPSIHLTRHFAMHPQCLGDHLDADHLAAFRASNKNGPRYHKQVEHGFLAGQPQNRSRW